MSHRSGSRYPSAYGHTPSYRSYSSIDTSTPYTSSAASHLGHGLGKNVFFEDYEMLMYRMYGRFGRG